MTSLANPFSFLFLFVGGELLGVPSTCAIVTAIDGVSPRAALREATPWRVCFGAIAGVAISASYLGFFVATSVGEDVLPATTAFGIVACNPLVGLLAAETWAWSRSTQVDRLCSRRRALTLC